MGTLIKDAWEGNRSIIVLASRAKAPAGNVAEALVPYLTKTQEAVKAIHGLRLDRDWDRHLKAVGEMLACLSWILFKPPQQLPSAMVKEALGSAEFWSNRIRKDFKGKDETQIAFCDNLKKAMTGLIAYIEEYHKPGLTWNPQGISLEEAAIRLTDEATPAAEAPATRPKPPALKGDAASGNVGGLIAELGTRKNSDGTSAATGLKKVTKDMQTWRKEYQGSGDAPKPAAAPKVVPKATPAKKTPLRGIPIFEYQDRGFKWIIENQTAESAKKESPDGVLKVEISDPKQQVYLYNCEGITVQVKGKFKSLVIDTCVKTAVVYDTLISSAEMVNCKKIQLQVTGICPVFTIDKTVGFLVWLSAESVPVSSFTTSLSSEMNVSYPDGEDQKEIPIPEQFVHKVGDGSMTSEVSDLYH
uniref:C-CAP/cofactor C-like domain-containing protein n=1 Tax=Entomoneis paludosa TaxID=265537 RepID=A0A7S3DXL2_9STRA